MTNNSIKKIAILSDTHRYLSEDTFSIIRGQSDSNSIYQSKNINNLSNNDSTEYKSLKKAIIKKEPNLIIHAGDIGKQEIVDELEALSPLIAVNGNCDFYTYQTEKGETKDFEIFKYEENSFTVTHCDFDLDTYIKQNISKINSLKNDNISQIFIHGHTHIPYITCHSNYVTLCPGSASQGRNGNPNTIAFLYIFKNKIVEIELVKV